LHAIVARFRTRRKSCPSANRAVDWACIGVANTSLDAVGTNLAAELWFSKNASASFGATTARGSAIAVCRPSSYVAINRTTENVAVLNSHLNVVNVGVTVCGDGAGSTAVGRGDKRTFTVVGASTAGLGA